MDPQKFGRYVIKGEIGRGGMATVYHAYDPRFEREVAIKVLPHEMLHDTQFRTRFEREAKTIAMLEHPAIVPVYDFGEEEGQPYFVMRYMTGGSLTDRMKGGPVSIQETARLIAHLAPALDEAHMKGIIHRDLKPANILFDQYNEPYVSDFGIAKLSSAQTQVTGSAIVGTPAYMSPEQAQGESIDGRSDIYGLGVILFEMLSGQQPYHGDTPMSVVVKHITDPVPHILDVKPDLPADLERVVEKAMAKDPTERFQNVKVLSDALNAVARGERPVLSSDAPTMIKTVVRKGSAPAVVKTMLTDKEPRQPDVPSEPKRRGFGLWIGLGLGAVLIIGLLAVIILVFKGKIPFLAAPVPTQTKLIVQDTLPPTLEPTQDVALLFTPTYTETPRPTDTPAPTATATLPALPVIGGADKLAFLSDNNIWVSGVDGAGLAQVSQDNTEKRDLQWGPDGDTIYYISGKCVHYVTVSTSVDVLVTCFTSATYLESFEISPDGKQVAISLDRVLYLVPFDVKAISAAKNWTYLRDMHGCLTYGYDQTLRSNQPVIKQVRWSDDGTRIAANTLSMGVKGRVDLILVFDVSRCDSNIQKWFDNFPGARFTMTGYDANPVIPFFSWDGQALFLLNSNFRYKAGYLYAYNYEKQKGADTLAPLKSCCYQSAVWSPDGTYIAFAYLDIDTNKTELYLIPYGTLGTGASYESFELPDTLFAKPAANIEIAFRPVK